MTAKVNIMLKNGILDPQGRIILQSLENIGIDKINEVRMGKLILLHFDDVSEDEAEKLAQKACTKLLANPIIEQFHIEIVKDLKSGKDKPFFLNSQSTEQN